MEVQNRKWIDIITILFFLITIFGISLGTFLSKDEKISYTERRSLKQRPEISYENIKNGKLFDEYEKYLLDQIIFREDFKSFKAYNNYYLLGQKDNHNIIEKNGYISKLNYPINEKGVELFYRKINRINEIIKDKKVTTYLTIIPDKNYYLINGDYPKIDYEELNNTITSKVNSKYINIYNLLSLEKFYKTDSHWSQEQIIPVANKILKSMNRRTFNEKYDIKELKPFYGVYYGNSIFKGSADTVKYIEWDSINNITFKRMNKKGILEESNIYDLEAFKGNDSYDLFLGGASNIYTFENNNNNDGKTLYVFSDSFGRSLVPLLVSNYKKVVFYDIRYISLDKALEKEPIEENSDVLYAFNIVSIDVASNLQVEGY